MPVTTYQPVFCISTPGASYSVIGDNGFSDSGTVGGSAVAYSAAQYPSGTYGITWTYQSSTRTDSFKVGPTVCTTYYFDPLPVTDAGSSGGSSTPSTAAGAPAAPTASNPSGPQAATTFPSEVTTPNPSSSSVYPFSWPPYEYGKYFTPTQAFMYVGNLYIDELIGFQYTLQSNRVPIFGYSSRKMDAVGTGKSLVQGQLNINFISEGYLYTVLNEYKTRTANAKPADEQAIANLDQQYKSLPSGSSGDAGRSAIKQQMLTLLGNNSNLASTLHNVRMAGNEAPSYNAAYGRTPFDIVLQFEGGGRTVTRRIEGCVLTSNEQILGDNDTPILDCYGFIARGIN